MAGMGTVAEGGWARVRGEGPVANMILTLSSHVPVHIRKYAHEYVYCMCVHSREGVYVFVHAFMCMCFVGVCVYV